MKAGEFGLLASAFPRFPVPQLSTLNHQPVRQRVVDARSSQAHTRPMLAGLQQRLKFMAKWEIRFQRFAISFRPSGFDFSIQPLAFVDALVAVLKPATAITP